MGAAKPLTLPEPPAANPRPRTESAAAGPRRLLDKAAAAEYLSVSTATIDRLIWSGQLPVVKLPVERAENSRGRVGTSRRVLIDVRDLDAIIDRSKESWR